MRQKSPAVLDYRNAGTAARRGRSAFGGFGAGWLLGTFTSGAAVAYAAGGLGGIVPLICIGTFLAGPPLFWLLCCFPKVAGNLAFVLALLLSWAVAGGLLVALVLALRGAC